MAKVDIATLDPAKTVVVATGNAHKVTEIEAILAPLMPGVSFYALGELGDFPDPVENGDTFTQNAIIKAEAALEQTGFAAVADDSGLVVAGLASMATTSATTRSSCARWGTCRRRSAPRASTRALS